MPMAAGIVFPKNWSESLCSKLRGRVRLVGDEEDVVLSAFRKAFAAAWRGADFPT